MRSLHLPLALALVFGSACRNKDDGTEPTDGTDTPSDTSDTGSTETDTVTDTGTAPLTATVEVQGSDGEPVDDVAIGDTLWVGVSDLEPYEMVEIYLTPEGTPPTTADEAISFARLTADGSGVVAPLPLWFDSGVVGCTLPAAPPSDHRFESFEAAAAALEGQTLRLSVFEVTGPDGQREAQPKGVLDLPAVQQTGPHLFASDAEGCLLHRSDLGSQDLFVSGTGFEPEQELWITVAPHQDDWELGELALDVTGRPGGDAPTAIVDASGRFTLKVWDAQDQRRGGYDVLARPFPPDVGGVVMSADDLVGLPGHVGVLLDPAVTTSIIDIAGRPVSNPHFSLGTWAGFQFSDGFAEEDDDVWAALDSSFVPANHSTFSPYAAVWVLPHRDRNAWVDNPTWASSDDPSGLAPEILPLPSSGLLQPHRIWPGPLQPGDWDVVVDFDQNQQFDPGTDFLDGGDQIGFSVLPDPYHGVGPMDVTCSRYENPDFYLYDAASGALPVDLTAEVCFPADSPGSSTPAAGQHPLFLIQHGAHVPCWATPFLWDSCDPADLIRSEQGHLALLENLAEHGIIAISIDGHAFNDDPYGNFAGRGGLFLRHLELWSHQHDPTTYAAEGYPTLFGGALEGHVDLSRIQLSGHSNGGRAVSEAVVMNTDFDIGSLSYIAPQYDGGYLPEVGDTPSFVILPAADGQLEPWHGVHVYDRVPGTATKSALWIYGANHQWFNTVWADPIINPVGEDDDADPDRQDKLTRDEQQRLGDAYLAAFARWHLADETAYRGMFTGDLVFPSTAGLKAYPLFHDASHLVIEDGTATLGQYGGVEYVTTSATTGDYLLNWNEALDVRWITAANPGSPQSISWNGSWNASTLDVLSMRAFWLDVGDDPDRIRSQWFILELFDNNGESALVDVHAHGMSPTPYPNERVPPFEPYTVLTNVRTPLQSFVQVNPDLDLSWITQVRLYFVSPAGGRVFLDDVEFSK